MLLAVMIPLLVTVILIAAGIILGGLIVGNNVGLFNKIRKLFGK